VKFARVRRIDDLSHGQLRCVSHKPLVGAVHVDRADEDFPSQCAFGTDRGMPMVKPRPGPTGWVCAPSWYAQQNKCPEKDSG
jgi:hypothetical protein